MAIESNSTLFVPKIYLYSPSNPLNKFLDNQGVGAITRDFGPAQVAQKLFYHSKSNTHKFESAQKIMMGMLNWLDKHNFSSHAVSILELADLSSFMFRKQSAQMPFIAKKLQPQLGLMLQVGDSWSNRVEKLINLSYQYGAYLDLSSLCEVRNSHSKWHFKNSDLTSVQGLMQSLESKDVSNVMRDFKTELNSSETNYARLRAYLIYVIKNLKSSDAIHSKNFLIEFGESLVQKVFDKAPNDLAGILFYLFLLKLGLDSREQKVSHGLVHEHIDSDLITHLTSLSKEHIKSNTRLNKFCETVEILVSNFNNLNLFTIDSEAVMLNPADLTSIARSA